MYLFTIIIPTCCKSSFLYNLNLHFAYLFYLVIFLKNHPWLSDLTLPEFMIFFVNSYYRTLHFNFMYRMYDILPSVNYIYIHTCIFKFHNTYIFLSNNSSLYRFYPTHHPYSYIIIKNQLSSSLHYDNLIMTETVLIVMPYEDNSYSLYHLNLPK